MKRATVLVLIALSVLPACSNTPGKIALVPLGHGLALGTAVRAGNLSVWPVLAEALPDIGRFRTLEEAQARSELAIHEREEAEVATLVIENGGDVPILACAGAVFTGGKQDRQLGEDIVIAARTTVPVKTFCVEQNRWHGGRTFVVNGKATRVVRAAGQYDGDQSGVWRGVADARASMGLKSGSYRAVAEARQKGAAKVVAHLRGHAGDVVGYAYALHGKLMGMRTFAHPKLFQPRLEALVRAVCAESEQATTAAPQPAAVSEELQRMVIYMRMASDAYDRSEYDLARAHAEKVLALEPNNERAKELLRIAKESRYAADQDKIRKEFHDEWHTVMAQLEAAALASPRVQRYLRDTGVDVTDFIPPQIPQVGVSEDSFVPLFANPSGSPGVQSGGAALPPSRGLFFTDGIEGDIRGFVEKEITLVPAVGARVVQTKGINRNTFRKTAGGNRSTCSIRGKDGRWIALTRDWTAR